MSGIADLKENLAATVAVGRAVQPEELAPEYVYLALEPDSSYTIGETIAVTGAMTDSR
ncbi:hypothetical protein [Streptomyces sp. NPDC051684]|uniref:hypothetical protein n=1 Tax=Streptomyces sp. NPDC051684 TaxID=3365670 RepID=UPI00378B9871